MDLLVKHQTREDQQNAGSEKVVRKASITSLKRIRNVLRQSSPSSPSIIRVALSFSPHIIPFYFSFFVQLSSAIKFQGGPTRGWNLPNGDGEAKKHNSSSYVNSRGSLCL
jgi:hypothetical protein